MKFANSLQVNSYERDNLVAGLQGDAVDLVEHEGQSYVVVLERFFYANPDRLAEQKLQPREVFSLRRDPARQLVVGDYDSKWDWDAYYAAKRQQAWVDEQAEYAEQLDAQVADVDDELFKQFNARYVGAANLVAAEDLKEGDLLNQGNHAYRVLSADVDVNGERVRVRSVRKGDSPAHVSVHYFDPSERVAKWAQGDPEDPADDRNPSNRFGYTR